MLFELVGFIMCERFETINDFTAAALGEFPEQYREIIVVQLDSRALLSRELSERRT